MNQPTFTTRFRLRGIKIPEITFSKPIRKRILQLVYGLNNSDEYHLDFDIPTYADQVIRGYTSETGKDCFAYDDQSHPKDNPSLYDCILSGPPVQLIDLLELYSRVLDTKEAAEFEKNLNRIFWEEDVPWAITGGCILKLDSLYFANLRSSVGELLKEHEFLGSMDEFSKAQAAYEGGDYKSAITYTNCAVESAIKKLLGIERGKPGELFKSLRDSHIVPEYLDGFLVAFEEKIVRAPAIMRNEDSGHGQGAEVKEVAPELSELALNLGGSLLMFLVRVHTLRTNEKSKVSDASP